MRKIKCVKLELEGFAGYLVDRIEGAEWRTQIIESELGEVFRVTVIEMDEAELKAMPEFDGF